MRKKAFTLAETLITLGIIGIIAALIIPAISKVKPDETKAMYLRTQRAVSMAVKSYASSLRPCNENGCYTNYPLFADDSSGLCNYLKDAFNARLVSQTPSSCKAEYKQFNDTNPDWSFITPEGQKFYVSADKKTDDNTYLAEIVFDINGDKEVNHLYDKTNYPNPDRFRLWVTADGNVTLGDAKGLDYTNKGLNWLKKDDNPDNKDNKPDNTKVVKDGQCRPGTNDCPAHSVYNSDTGECECVEGYEKVNGVCVEIGNSDKKLCEEQGGTWNDTTKTCTCPDGNTWNANSKIKACLVPNTAWYKWEIKNIHYKVEAYDTNYCELTLYVNGIHSKQDIKDRLESDKLILEEWIELRDGGEKSHLVSGWKEEMQINDEGKSNIVPIEEMNIFASKGEHILKFE